MDRQRPRRHNVDMDDAGPIPPLARLKRFQRFGADGPVYEVLGPGGAPDCVAIRVIESGEELDYSYLRAGGDPEA